jgi:hypothetical protein
MINYSDDDDNCDDENDNIGDDGYKWCFFQVSSVFVDKARCGTVYPKEVPYLQRIQPKDPISLENLGYVRQLHLISAHILAGIQC